MIEVNRSMRATIRRAAESDAPGLLRLNEKFNGKSNLSAEQIRLSLAVNDREDVFVAEQEGKLAGFCCVQIFQSFCYEVRYAEITELYVDDAYQRRGIGRELLGYVERYYEDTDIKGFQLCISLFKTIISQSPPLITAQFFGFLYRKIRFRQFRLLI